MSSVPRSTFVRPLARTLLAVALATGGVAAIAADIRPASAQPDPRTVASAHYAEGKRRFDSGDYRGAIMAFGAADQALPSGINDYNIALAYERLDDAVLAIRFYRSYLDRMPSAPNRAEVEASIARLELSLKSAEDARQAEAARQAAEARAAEDAKAAEAARAAQAAEDAARAAAEAQAAEEARAAEPVRLPAPPAPGRLRYPLTGDRELDRVAEVDLDAIRAAEPLPPLAAQPAATGPAPATAPTAGTAAPAPAPAPDQPKKKRPFYKNPVTWVLAGVGIYVIYVLASSSSSNDPQPGTGRLLLPELDTGATSPGPTLFRF